MKQRPDPSLTRLSPLEPLDPTAGRRSRRRSVAAAIAPLAFCALVAAPLLQGCAVARDQQTVGSYVDDTTLTTRIKAKFAADSAVSALAINVETLKGVVQLSGFAKTAQERDTAEALARSVQGVVSVRNDIIVRA